MDIFFTSSKNNGNYLEVSITIFFMHDDENCR